MKVLNYKIKRVSRLYYWVAWVLCNVIFNGIYFVMAMEIQNYDIRNMIAAFAVVLTIQILYMALLTIKRFHDVGESTGYCILCMLLSLIIIGNIMILLVVIKDSDTDNQWGVNPEKRLYEKNKDFYAR